MGVGQSNTRSVHFGKESPSTIVELSEDVARHMNNLITKETPPKNENFGNVFRPTSDMNEHLRNITNANYELERKFNNSIDSFEKSFTSSTVIDCSSPCMELQEKLASCYKQNVHTSLLCNSIAVKFTNCINQTITRKLTP